MASDFQGFQTELGEMSRKVGRIEDKLHDDVKELFKHAARWSKASMKARAPWTDRTTNARRGLDAQFIQRGEDGFELVLSGSVYYQIYLELKNNGKYAIIMPVSIEAGRHLMKGMQGLMNRSSVAGIFPAVPSRPGRGGTRGIESYGRRKRKAGSQTVRRSRV